MANAVVIGIDPGLTTGWCIAKDMQMDVGDEGEVVTLSIDSFEGGTWKLTQAGRSYVEVLYAYVKEIIEEQRSVNLVCYEEPVARGNAAKSLNRQIAAIILACEHSKVPHYPVNPGTLKKYATGKGNESKEEMVAESQAVGYPGTDHNEVDAFWLAGYGIDYVLPAIDNPEGE